MDLSTLPDEVGVTIAEPRAGVLAAGDLMSRDRRLATLTATLLFDPLSIDLAVAATWATLHLALRDAWIRTPVNDSWIAATAIAHAVPILGGDDDLDVPGLEVIEV